MADTPIKNDPSAEWPEEVKQAYDHLKVPSLYDAIIANEKLSLEIRRQDRELKTIAEGMQQLTMQMGELLKIIEEEEDEDEEEEEILLVSSENGIKDRHGRELTQLEMELLEENQLFLQKQSQILLIETHDDIRDLWRIAKQCVQQVMLIMPKTEGIIPHEPVWHSVAEQMLQGILESVEKSRYQLLSRLEQVEIKLIEPQQGETVNPALHYIVDHIPGGKGGTIAKVVRVGYKQDQEVLRLAEVTVYH